MHDGYGVAVPWDDGEVVGIKLAGIVAAKPNSIHRDAHFHPRLFRKIQRRDLSAWLQTAATDTDHLDKPIKTPARPKVDALLKRVQSGAFG